MKKTVIPVCIIFTVLLYNIIIFFVVPGSLPEIMYYFDESRYDHPSFVNNKQTNSGSTYYYPLISIEDDDSEYLLIKGGLFGYSVDSSTFLKKHKYDLIVFNPENYYGTTYDFSYELYKDGELVDLVPCAYWKTQSFDFIMFLGTNIGSIICATSILLLTILVIFRYRKTSKRLIQKVVGKQGSIHKYRN